LTSRTSGSAGSYRGGEACRERRASERTPRVGRTYHIRQISRRTSNCRHATSRHITSRSTTYKANHSRRILIALPYPIPVPMPDQTCSKRPQSMHPCRHSYPIHKRESRSGWPRPRPRSRQGKASHLIASSYLAASSRLVSRQVTATDLPRTNVSKHPPHRIRDGAKLTYLPQLQAPAAQPQSAQVQPAVPQPGIFVVFVGVVGLCWVE
jgi:hypothetical protein